jgi:hypothetical protein
MNCCKGTCSCLAQVVGSRTTVDVQWQDGSCAAGAAARDFLPVSFHDEHDFAVGDFVEQRDPFADMDESPTDGASQPPQVVPGSCWTRQIPAPAVLPPEQYDVTSGTAALHLCSMDM